MGGAWGIIDMQNLQYVRYLDISQYMRESIFLWGARKVGKSTFLKSIFKKSLYIDLLKTDILMRGSPGNTRNPSSLREEILALPEHALFSPVIIDEVQKIYQLLDEVHRLIENNPPGAYFVLCGSSAKKLKQKGKNLLGGRAIKCTFYPLVYPEYKDDFDPGGRGLRIQNHGLIPSHFLSKYS